MTKKTWKAPKKGKVNKKKKTRRDNTKYPELEERFVLPSRQDIVDVPYKNGIYDDDGNEVMRPWTEEEKEWMNKFLKEYNSASLCSPDKAGTDENTDFHKTPKERKICTDRNNARNRCIYTRAKAGKTLKELDIDKYDKFDKYRRLDLGEDILIGQIEFKDKQQDELIDDLQSKDNQQDDT